MGLQLTDVELNEFLTGAHTAMVTTLRRDGWPVTLPLWFVWSDGHLYLRTPPGSTKLKRIRRDERCSVLVESGDRWVDLKAAHMTARAVILDAGPEAEHAARLIDEKYRAFEPPWNRLPEAIIRNYAAQVVIRLDATADAISWDNSKIRLSSE